MAQHIQVAITSTPIVIQEAFDFVLDPKHGAIATFIGSIRNHNQGKEVIAVTYDIFEPLAKKILFNLCQQASQQWRDLKIFLTHFKGRLAVGETSVIIAVSSPHRDEAFKACRYIIEELKQHAPIWKQEHYLQGDSEWMKGHALCAAH
jgi:molybdopterin synthase catalytic subunit